MKPLLVTLLVLSLAGNFVGAYFVFRRSAGPDLHADATNSGTHGSTNANDAEARAKAEMFAADAKLWAPLFSTNDLSGLVTRLRAAGFPPKVVRGVIQQLVNERIVAASRHERRAYWPMENQTKAQEQWAAANRQRQDLLESLLGPEGGPAALLDDSYRNRVYGDLSNDKIEALMKLDRNYQEVMNQVMGDRMTRTMTAEDVRRFAQERELVEREKRVDLANILTPAELEQYEMRNSQTANQLAQGLRQIEVNEQEYIALYRLQKSLDDKYPQGFMTPDSYGARQAAQLELNEQIRSVLSEQRFYDYLSGSDGQFNQTKEFAKNYPEITSAGTYEVYRLQQQLQLASQAIGQNQSLTPEQRSEQMRSLATDYGTRLSALLGPETYEAFKKSPQGWLLNTAVTTPASGRP